MNLSINKYLTYVLAFRFSKPVKHTRVCKKKKRDILHVSFVRWINVCFWETDHLPLSHPNINPYFSLWEKWKLRGGVGGQFPRNIH